MREILFRGKRTDNGNWVTDSASYIEDSDGVWLSDNTDVVKIIPETVGQFTGLCDKNGRKIFEGDIIKYNELHGKIVCCDDIATIVVYFTNGWNTDFSVIYAKYAEVVGNIHDNPELMKGE